MELQKLDSNKVLAAAGRPITDLDNAVTPNSQSKSVNGSSPSPRDVDAVSSQTNGSARRTGVTRQQRNLARLQYATLLWTLLLAGWNDGTTGPLLPRIQVVYHVSLHFIPENEALNLVSPF